MMMYAEYRPLASHPQNGEGRDSDMGPERKDILPNVELKESQIYCFDYKEEPGHLGRGVEPPSVIRILRWGGNPLLSVGVSKRNLSDNCPSGDRR